MGLLSDLLGGGGGSSQNQGGGFFGSGASNSNTETNSNQTTQNAEAGGINVNLSNLQFGEDEKFGDPSQGSGSSSGSGFSINNTSYVLDGGAIESAYNFAEEALNGVLNVGQDIFESSAGVVTDALQINADNSLAVISSAENFADLAALQSIEFADRNAALADTAINAALLGNNNVTNIAFDAISASERANTNTTNFAYDTVRELGNAYGFANQGLLDLSADTIDSVENLASYSLNQVINSQGDSLAYLGSIQDDALYQIGESTNAAQNASLKAIDYIFESSKTAEERTLTSATKWIIAGVVLMFAVPALAGSFK